MKPSILPAVCVAFCLGGCTKATQTGQTVSSWGQALFKKEEPLVSTLEKKQNASLLRLAQQQREAEEASNLRRREASSRRVPPSMYRTTEPPLPEPDLTLPVQDISPPTSSPTPKPDR